MNFKWVVLYCKVTFRWTYREGWLWRTEIRLQNTTICGVWIHYIFFFLFFSQRQPPRLDVRRLNLRHDPQLPLHGLQDTIFYQKRRPERPKMGTVWQILLLRMQSVSHPKRNKAIYIHSELAKGIFFQEIWLAQENLTLGNKNLKSFVVSWGCHFSSKS